MQTEAKHHFRTFWELWSKDLPVSYDKGRAIEILSEHFNIKKRQTFRRISDNNILASDIRTIYLRLGIGFNIETGFFLDSKQYQIICQNEEMECASMFGLSKSI